jgi:hypothetical protein
MLGKLIPPQFMLTAYLIAAVAVAGVGYWIYDTIYDRGWDAHVVISEKEKAAQLAANNQAIAIAEKGLREDIALLLVDKEKLENDVARLDAEAAADPDAHSGGIKRDSVRRINTVR